MTAGARRAGFAGPANVGAIEPLASVPTAAFGRNAPRLDHAQPRSVAAEGCGMKRGLLRGAPQAPPTSSARVGSNWISPRRSSPLPRAPARRLRRSVTQAPAQAAARWTRLPALGPLCRAPRSRRAPVRRRQGRRRSAAEASPSVARRARARPPAVLARLQNLPASRRDRRRKGNRRANQKEARP